MNLTISKKSNYYIIALEGDLDASSALQLDTAIKNALEQNENKIVTDCSNLKYVSSSGLGVFISYLSDFERDKIYFALINVNDKILKTLDILGLTKLLNILEHLPND